VQWKRNSENALAKRKTLYLIVKIVLPAEEYTAAIPTLKGCSERNADLAVYEAISLSYLAYKKKATMLP